MRSLASPGHSRCDRDRRGGFRPYRNRDLMLLAGWSLVEVLWYQPLTALWRTWATMLFLLGRRPGWGSIARGIACR